MGGGGWSESGAYAQADSTPPTVSLEFLRPGTNETVTSPTNLDEVTLKFTFSEVINRNTFGADDIVLPGNANIAIGSITPASNQTIYTAEITNLASADGTTDFCLSGIVEDLAGNIGLDFPCIPITIDQTRPVPTFHVEDRTLSVIPFTVDFEETVDPVAFTTDDIELSTGTASNIVTHNNQTFEFDVEHGLYSGSLTVAIRANATTDAAGNYNSASGPFAIEVDREPPIARSSAESSQTSEQAGTLKANSTTVEVDAVPIVVNSTTADYFVLYVRHALENGTSVDLPVSVTLGGNGTTTLAENVAALPAERYRVEKYLVADPADVDGDGIDDITELADPVGMNPVNPAAAIELSRGAVAIPDRATFDALSLPGLEAVKFAILDADTDRPRIYFQDIRAYNSHHDFLASIGIDDPFMDGMITGLIGYYWRLHAPDGSPGLYLYRLNYVQPFSTVDFSLTVLAASMPLLEDDLAYHIINDFLLPYQPEITTYEASRINLVFDEDTNPKLDFSSLNQAEGYGFLRVMDLDERPNPRDVVIYETLPNDIPHVAGIITTVFQTPLSHVNLRAVQGDIPNAFIHGALNKPGIADLIGSYVRYEVMENNFSIHAATAAEVDAHYASSRPAVEQTPQRDLSVTEIAPLSEIDFGDWTAFGVKAANVAVLGTFDFPEGTVPDGFAIPFYFYDEFMKHNGLYDDIDEMLASPDFQANHTVQESELKKLRKAIKKGETPQWIIDALNETHGTYPEEQSLRYRSSTNNEDLPGFNGAGLYDSKTQHPEETEEDGISKSLKQVYASLWNFRAFIERDFHRINHTAAAMGVLVHPNYSDELANGVAVSFNPLWNDGIKYYYVNTQLGEDLVTNPDAHSTPEEVLVSTDGKKSRHLRTSNQVPPGQLLVSDDQLKQLVRHLTVIHEKFAELYGTGSGEEFAMEIEFKITSDNVLAIKQARPWIFDSMRSQQVDDTAPPTFSSAAYSTGIGLLAITFSEDLQGACRSLKAARPGVRPVLGRRHPDGSYPVHYRKYPERHAHLVPAYRRRQVGSPPAGHRRGSRHGHQQ